MPSLGRVNLANVAIGFFLSGLFVTLLIWFNIGGLGHHVAVVSDGWVMLVLLWVMFGGLFTGLQIVLSDPGDDDDDDDQPRGGRRDRRSLQRDSAVIPVRADEVRGDFWSKR